MLCLSHILTHASVNLNKKKTETILKINRKPEILPNDNKLLLEIYAGRCQFAGYIL